MTFNDNQTLFLEKLAQSEVGSELVRLLKSIETYYADIRNLKGTPADVRIDALKLLREALLDKLLVLSGKEDKPDLDEYH